MIEIIKWGLFETEIREFMTKRDMQEIMQEVQDDVNTSVPIHCEYWGPADILLFNTESDASRWLHRYWPSYIESTSRRFKFGQKPVNQLFKYTIKKQKIKL